MTLCRKCGKEIPDGEELCESCKNNPTEIDESYLDELMKSMEQTQKEMGAGLNTDGTTQPKMHDAVEEIIPEELSFGSPADRGADPLTAEPVAQEEPLADIVEPEIEGLSLDDLSAATEAETASDIVPEEPTIEESVPEEMPAESVTEDIAEEPSSDIVLDESSEPEPEMEAPALDISDIAPDEPPEPEMEDPSLDISGIAPDESPEPEMENPAPEDVALEEQPESAGGDPDQEEDINKLLDMLSGDYAEEEINTSSESSNQDPSPEIGFDAEPETPAFDGNDDGFFADTPEEEADATGPSLDDVFNEALSAVEYSENEGGQAGENADEPFALDDFGMEEEFPTEAEPSADSDESEGVTVQPAKKPKLKRTPKTKKSKPEVSFWKRVFGNIVTPETAELEAKEREDEAASKEQKAKLKEEKKQKDAEEKALKAEQQKADKDKKAAEKAEKAAVAKAKKEEKKRVRLEQEANEVVGKINPVGATIVMVFFGVICLVIILGTQAFSYSRAVKSAQSEFDAGDYEDAYNSISGVNVSESSEEMVEKVRICMQLKKELNSYNNYYKMKMYLEAVDSLMKGVRSYDTNKDTAYSYNIMAQYDALKDKIVSTLNQEFGITEAQARAINNTESRVEYTEKLQEIVNQWQNKVKQDEK